MHFTGAGPPIPTNPRGGIENGYKCVSLQDMVVKICECSYLIASSFLVSYKAGTVPQSGKGWAGMQGK